MGFRPKKPSSVGMKSMCKITKNILTIEDDLLFKKIFYGESFIFILGIYTVIELVWIKYY